MGVSPVSYADEAASLSRRRTAVRVLSTRVAQTEASQPELELLIVHVMACLVNLNRHSTTVIKVAEGCVYVRRRFVCKFLVEGGLEHSALPLSALRSPFPLSAPCSLSVLCPLIQRR